MSQCGTNNEQLKIELLSQLKLEAESRNLWEAVLYLINKEYKSKLNTLPLGTLLPSKASL